MAPGLEGDRASSNQSAALVVQEVMNLIRVGGPVLATRGSMVDIF